MLGRDVRVHLDEQAHALCAEHSKVQHALVFQHPGCGHFALVRGHVLKLYYGFVCEREGPYNRQAAIVQGHALRFQEGLQRAERGGPLVPAGNAAGFDRGAGRCLGNQVAAPARVLGYVRDIGQGPAVALAGPRVRQVLRERLAACGFVHLRKLGIVPL